MERLLKIKNYRNIGVKGEEVLLLNTSLKLGEMGNVVTLIGENNLGKSSIIAALKKYGENSLNKTDDIYDNEFEEKLDPELTLIVRDGDNEFYHDKSISVQDDVNGYSYKLANPSSDYDQQSFEMLKSIEDIFNKLEVYGRNSYYNNIQNFLNYVKELSDVDALIKCNPSKCSEIKNILSYIKDYVGGNNPDIAKKIEENGISFDNVIEYLRLKEQGFAGEFKRAFFNLYDFNFEPKILQYKQKERLSDSHLTVNWNFDVNSIVGVVLNYLGYSKESISRAYSLHQQSGSRTPLKNLEKQVNSKMSIIDEKFNSVFRTNSTSYSFSIIFESDYIRLVVSCGGKELLIKRNSEGFSWFFNFFFNFILKYEPNPGDIVLMDDEGYGLMPQGIYELHKYLQEYAKQKDVTFVIATCNEHFVDLNYLEEIRIVDRIDEDKARITSKITLFNDGDIDALKQIKKAIMVNGNIFDEDDVQQVYVEGITDYNYLTGFAKLLNIKGLVFIPFNGVKREEIELKLRRKNHTNIFLVDGDEEALAFKEKVSNETDSTVFSLADVDAKFITIESLFKKSELERFGLEDKSYNNSCNFKQNILKYVDDISKETKKNFKRVLEYIKEY